MKVPEEIKEHACAVTVPSDGFLEHLLLIHKDNGRQRYVSLQRQP